MSKGRGRNLRLPRLSLPGRTLRFLLVLGMVLMASDWGRWNRTEGQSVSTCNITYRIVNQWNVGFQTEVTIINNGPAISGWTVTWGFPGPQSIYELWNGSYTQSGANVTVKNASYNGSIPTGGKITFGFNANLNAGNSRSARTVSTRRRLRTLKSNVPNAPSAGSSGSDINPLPTSFTLNGQTCGGAGGATPAIIASVNPLSVNEGGSAQFGVRLSAAPSANVTVNIARVSGDADLALGNGASLSFTPANFATPQMVSISAAEDGDQVNGTAVFRASGAGVTSADVNVSEVDNDTGAIAIATSVTTLTVNEGGNAQFGVRLSAAPSASLTVNVARQSGDTDLTVSGGATLTFTPANFAAAQMVTISAAEDGDQTSDTAIFRVSGTGVTSADVSITEGDNDQPISILASLTRTLAVVESGTAQFGLKLAAPPAGNVTVNVTRLSGDADLTVSSGATLTFTPANFATFQTVTLSAAEDADITNGTAMIRASGTGLTNGHVNVSEFDNDGTPIAQRTYVAMLNGALEVPPVATSATGSAVVILAPDGLSALVSLNFSGLSSGQTAGHLHGPADPGSNAGVLLDLDQPLGPVANQLWEFAPVGGVSAQDQITALKTGRIYANVHTANNPAGEIRGHLFPVDAGGGGGGGSGGGGFADAARFLEQASFGPTVQEANRVMQIGMEAWLTEQFNAPMSNYQNLVQLQKGTFVDYPVKLQFFRNAMTGQDQLRQRVAFALSQIVVAAGVGNQDGDNGDPTAMVSQYHDILTRNAFGNYRTLIREISVSPIMGTYLTLVNSKKTDAAANTQADENYIRELWQLFTIGTFKLNPDGSVQLDAQGRPLESYTIADIQEGARALTGWVYAPKPGQPNLPENPFYPFAPMITNEANHDTGSKTLLNSAFLPAGRTAEQDLESVIDNVFNHPNVGPFIGRQLIQHLVTSNPSPAYISRITAVFNDNGSGVRGDLRAVVRAILLDPEARGNSRTEPVYGRLREPALFLTHLFRALNCGGGMWGIPQRSRMLGQNVFSAPSVFSFYQPDFRIVVNGQALFAPPAQLLTTSTIITRLNFLNDFLFGNLQAGGDPNPTGGTTTSVVLNLATWDQLAANPAQLVDGLNEALMHNSMSSQMRQTMINAVSGIQNNNRLRVQTAIYIIASSMQYQVQR